MVTLPPGVDIEALKRAYFLQSNRLTDEVALFASRNFAQLGNWRDDAVEDYLRSVLPVVAAGQNQISNLARAFYASAAEYYGQPFTNRPIPTGSVNTQAVRGTPAADVYSRGFLATRFELSKGKSLDQAVKMGASRIYNIARTDMQLAKTNTGLFVRGNNDNIVGYSRILSGAENCALCYVASTQRYTRGDLLPIHPGCDCGEMPIYGNSDPGQVIDEANLEATHDAVASRFGRAARDGREIDYRQIMIRQHGEIGPVLTVRGQNFTGPSEV
jgi:hypothetical protein